ncbi:hypothetical protein [Hymenobacter rubripertinctus]|nr:hypothetical protein [Hymenobacter rubripertinctus]
MTHILGKRDLPKDGWELIKRNLGYQDDGTPYSNLVNPYVVLYNRHSGMMRVFVAVGKLVQDYNYAEIKLVFNGTAQKKAGTLNRLEGIGVALENTVPGRDASVFSAVTRFTSQETKWFMADFPMDYDPCACQFDSKLVIEVNLISEANIKLEGITTGTLLSVKKSDGTNYSSTDFDKGVSVAKKVNGVLKKSQTTYKTISSYTSSVLGTLTTQGTKTSAQDANAKKNAFAQLMSALATNSFLKNGLNSVPYIGAAVSILDSFIGGGKDESGPQAVSIQPMSINMTTSLTVLLPKNWTV